MATFVLLLTGAVIVAAAVRAYWVSRDSLHPTIFLAPMMLYIFAFRPWILVRANSFAPYFDDSKLLFVLCFKLAACICFYAGCLHGITRVVRQSRLTPEMYLTPQGRDRAYLIGCALGLLGVAAYVFLIVVAGGFTAVYSDAYGTTAIVSGYIYEAPMLSLPAILFLAIARRGLRLQPIDVALVILFISPMLLHGMLGARRGPSFFALGTMFLAWYIYAQRRPSLVKLLIVIGCLGALALSLVTYRSQIYLGSKFDIDPNRFIENVFRPEVIRPGEDVLDSSGVILTVAKHGHVNWGTRWLVTYLVRPIPKQLWRTKYADCGFDWLENHPGSHGYTDWEWSSAAGFIPAYGCAVGFDASMFMDFSWAGFIGCYLFGFFFAWVWRKERLSRGVWHLLLVAALVLSIYVPTQDTSAVLFRWLFMAIPTVMCWQFFVGRRIVYCRTPRPKPDAAATGKGSER